MIEVSIQIESGYSNVMKMSNAFQVEQDLWMKALHFHGPLLLQTVLGEVRNSEGEAESDKLKMCRFIKNKLHLLFKPSDSTFDNPPDHAIPTVPIELFQNSSPVDRRDLFYKSLDRGNILILRVINDTLQDNYKLLVLCKHEICMKLDDLSIIMYLPKLPAELELAGGKLESNDLIRAAVCSCSIDERKLYVTLDSTVLEDEAENVKLGKISEKDLPFYVGNVDIGSSYVEYLHHKPEFNNPNWAEELHTVLNLNRKYQYSFIDVLDGKEYPREEYGAELRKKQMLTLSNEQQAKAQKYYESANFTEAFMCLNTALSIYPKNIEALVSRGTLYANTNNLRKAFVDMEEALKIDPNHTNARCQMSILLVSAARLHIEQDDLDKAQESLDAALNLDSNNKDAIVAVEEIRKKTSGSDKLDKASSKPEKKSQIGSGSSDSSSSKKDEKEKQEISLEVSTRTFISSFKKKHHHDRKRSHHHSHHKSRSKSPKRKLLP